MVGWRNREVEREEPLTAELLEPRIDSCLKNLHERDPKYPKDDHLLMAKEGIREMLLRAITDPHILPKSSKNPWFEEKHITDEMVTYCLRAAVRQTVVMASPPTQAGEFRPFGALTWGSLKAEFSGNLHLTIMQYAQEQVVDMAEKIVQNPGEFDPQKWYEATAPALPSSPSREGRGL